VRNGFIKVKYIKKLLSDNVIPGFYCIDIISDEQEDMDVYDREDYQEEAD